MGRLVEVLHVIGGLLASALSKQVADEFKAWTPWLTKHLVDFSISKLPSDLREGYQEEWSRHVEDTPGQIGKLIIAISFLHAAAGIRTMVERRVWTVRIKLIKGTVILRFIRFYRVFFPSNKWRQHVTAPLTPITFFESLLTSFNLWMITKLEGLIEMELTRTLELKRNLLHRDNQL